MVDNKSKTSLIRQKQKKNISLMKINNTTLMLRILIILLSLYLFLLEQAGSENTQTLAREYRQKNYQNNSGFVIQIWIQAMFQKDHVTGRPHLV